MDIIINYLIENPDILEKVKNGTASLLGVTEDEKSAILTSFNDLNLQSYFWR
ncbi:competence pheromone ComX [Metabacillus halosaccharovorans]|uniref:competence pheromone ComX n=1 Tax=Metabacillus halosaccharovorans TaxID=930124 RepID=UPI001C1FD447|nr:competence pheromone ComX [Metabacillus halosaccharovorans]MBU7591438.1 competence pheromone ComX [Metabacillus halosaccharovorans]